MINLGHSLETIGNSAFSDNNILSLTIPDSVISIGDYAFAMNPSVAVLTSVTVLATTPPSISTGTNDTFNISTATNLALKKDVKIMATAQGLRVSF